VTLTLEKIAKQGARSEAAEIDMLIIAGWTGRDQEAMERHMRELEAIGVARPRTAPIFYRVAASLLTTAPVIEVSGTESSGEIEVVLLRLADGLWVGVGSDHTDRKAETINVSLSKQMCAKPVSPSVWRFDEVRPHWDRLVLRSHIVVGDTRSLYQEGPVTTMRDPQDLIERYGGLRVGAAMFCGTLAVKGGIRQSDAFEMQLEDPVLGRSIVHRYQIVPLPVEG
jgi:hypothetical protein